MMLINSPRYLYLYLELHDSLFLFLVFLIFTFYTIESRPAGNALGPHLSVSFIVPGVNNDNYA